MGMADKGKRIPIAAGKRIADEYGYDQVVIIARAVGDDGTEHVTTYGVDKAHCDVAARMGNFFKHKLMGWPEKQQSAEAAILADRDRRIEALTAEVDSWKASYMALAPDHDIAMLRANSRIEALTKALHRMCKIADFMPDEVAELLHAEARELLASAAGAEGEA